MHLPESFLYLSVLYFLEADEKLFTTQFSLMFSNMLNNHTQKYLNCILTSSFRSPNQNHPNNLHPPISNTLASLYNIMVAHRVQDFYVLAACAVVAVCWTPLKELGVGAGTGGR